MDIFRVYAKPGVGGEELRQRIVERLGKQRHMFVMLNAEVREYVGKLMDQWFGMTYLQMLVAVSVAVLGIVNTLTVSITDRRRELGVLRAVGGLRGADPPHGLDGGGDHRAHRAGSRAGDGGR